jgi:4-hydroxy-tetrahydrodipicolinate synthase
MAEYRRSEAKEWARESLRGYIAVMFTPYDEKGAVDSAAVRRDVEHTLNLPGIAGLYVGSIYQEFWLLSEAERRYLAEVVIDAVHGRVPVIVSASHTVLESAVSLADHARAAGAAAVMLWPPYFGPRSQSGVLDFYTAVMDKVDIGFAFYNTGLSEVGFEMAPPLLKALARLPQMCILKEASLRLDTFLQTLSLIGQDVVVSSPLEEFWLAGRMLAPDYSAAMLMGSSRVLFLQTAAMPKLDLFFQAAMSGRNREADALLSWILATGEAIHGSALRAGEHPIGLIKAVCGAMGLSGGAPRPPCARPSQTQLEAALAGLRAAGLDLADPR